MVNKPIEGKFGWAPTLNAYLDSIDVTNPASAASAALSATYAPIGATTTAVNTVVWMGDSLTAGNGGLSIATPVQAIDPLILDSKGMHNWANVFLGHDLEVLGNAGIGGQESDQIAARFTTDVLAYSPAIVVILAGINDEETDATTTNLTTMYEAALGAGILCCAVTIPPSTGSTSAVRDHRLKVNGWIRDWCRSHPGMVLADVGAAWHDPSLAGFSPFTTYVADGVHPTTLGAMVAGRVIAAALRPFVPFNRHRAAPAVAPFNMLTNPHFNGSGPGDPTGWGVTGSGLTKSYASRTDGFAGQSFNVVVPTGGSVIITSNVTIDGTLLAIGDSFDFICEVEAVGIETGAVTRNIYAYVQQYNGSSFSDRAYDCYWDAGAAYLSGLPLPDGTYGFRTPPRVVTSGKTLVQAVVVCSGGGTYKFKGAGFRNLTKIALTV